MGVRGRKFLFPLHWGILPKAMLAKVITLGFCNILNSYRRHYKIMHDLINFELNYWNTLYLRQWLKNIWKLGWQSSFFLMWFLHSMPCLQPALEVLKLCNSCLRISRYKWKWSFQPSAPIIQPSFFILHPISTDWISWCSFVIIYLKVSLLLLPSKITVCSSSLLTFELCSRTVFQD